VTVPVGTPSPAGLDVTVAVTVTTCPNTGVPLASSLRVVTVAASLTCCVSDDELFAKLPVLSVNWADTEWLPRTRPSSCGWDSCRLAVALPVTGSACSGTVCCAVPSTENVTEPAGSPEPGPTWSGVTVAVNVTGAPKLAGFAAEARLTVVVSWFTVTVAAGDGWLALKLLSPTYRAVTEYVEPAASVLVVKTAWLPVRLTGV